MKYKNNIVSGTTLLLIGLVSFIASVRSEPSTGSALKNSMPRRFFSDDSYWNQPLPENPKIHPYSEQWIKVLAEEPVGAYFGINTDRYTIPVYEADEKTPTYTIYHRPVNDHFKKVHGYKNGWFEKNEFYGHGKGFGKKVPIPANAISDPEEDSHIVVVDWKKNLVWDVWGLEIIDGKYHSFTGMKYNEKQWSNPALKFLS